MRVGPAFLNRELLRASPDEAEALTEELESVLTADNAMQEAIRRVNEETGSGLCPQSDGSLIDLRVSSELKSGASGEEIKAHFDSINQEFEYERTGKRPDYGRGEVDRLIGGDIEMLKKHLELEGHNTLMLRNGNCETVLHVAINRGLTDRVRVILSAHPEINLRTRSGQTPLMLAVKRNDVEMTKMLLDAGAAVSLHDYGAKSRETALSLGVTAKAWEAVRVLLLRGASPTAGKPAESTLVRAYLEGQRELVLEMVRRGADPGFAVSTRQSLVQFLTSMGDQEMLEQIRIIYPDATC
jgi:hypothetical protein